MIADEIQWLFAINCREVGRRQFFAAGVAYIFILGVVTELSDLIGFNDQHLNVILACAAILLYGSLFIKRLRNFGANEMWGALIFIPFVNVGLFIYLCLRKTK